MSTKLPVKVDTSSPIDFVENNVKPTETEPVEMEPIAMETEPVSGRHWQLPDINNRP